MTSRRHIHPLIHEWIRVALRAADPREAIRRHVHRDGDFLVVEVVRYDLRNTDIRLIAVGKAAAPMATEVAELLGDQLARAVVVTKYGHAEERRDGGAGEQFPPLPGSSAPPHLLTIIESAHPIPDDNSLRAGELVCDAIRDCTEQTLLIACVSGGASALMVAPYAGISLNTIRAINHALLKSGADIREMNAVRSRLDRLKGGGLVRMAQPAHVVGLILSDVVGDPLDVIASGLTNDPRAHNVLVGNNTQSCEAVVGAARELGYEARIVTTNLHGEARDVGAQIARELANLHQPLGAGLRARGNCLIYGGETTVTIRGDGRGGRNQELALSAAIELDSLRRGAVTSPHAPLSQTIIASFGTDGTDGPTDAAGAIATTDTLKRARLRGLEARDYLERNDSYHFFEALGDLIITGPTGTNVADVVIALHH